MAIKKGFQLYENAANSTIKELHKQIYVVYGTIGVLSGLLLGVLLFGISVPLLITGVIGLVLGVLTGFILIKIGQKKYGRLSDMEKSEGYSDAVLAEAYNFFNKDKDLSMKISYAITAAVLHNFRGEFSQALKVLPNINETSFETEPSTAKLYYSQKMMAYLCLGDLDHSADAYSRLLHFIQTDNVCSTEITLSLGVYEFYCGHYETSIQLLDNSLQANQANLQGEYHIPAEHMTTMLCYWKAMNLAAMGNKAAAWDSLNYCKNFYKTPYYQQCCEKLLADMAENHKSEMIENAETLP